MKIIIVILSLFFCSLLMGQINTFNNTYTSFHLADLRNVIVYEAGYIALGGGRDLTDPTGNIRIILLHFDSIGNIVWQKSYGNDIYNFYHGTRNALIKNNDNNYSLAGSINNDTANACLLIKFDNNFDTLWTKTYFNNSDFTVFYNHIQTSDGGYALVGSNDEDDPDGDVLLVKTDNLGNMQWYKKYGTSERDLGVCIIETPDNGFLIGGTSSYYGNKDGYLIKTDNEGNLEWTKHFGNPLYPDGSIYTLIRTTQNEYIIPLTTYVTDPISGPFYNRKYNIIKLDSDFNEVWDKQYGVRAEYTSLGTIKVTDDGNIWATIKDDRKVGLFHLSSNGDSISKHYYSAEGSIGDMSLLSIKQTEDNGFIMAGVAYEPQVMWLVKTDSCGCITEECDCGGSPVQQVFASKKIEVYPNPANNILHFDLSEYVQSINIEIYDNLGRLIITNKLLGWENTIDVSELKQGNYFVRLNSVNEYWTGWFVKE